MPTGSDLGPDASIWWLDYAMLLEAGAIVLLIVSLTARRWGPRVTSLLYRSDLALFEPTTARIGRSLPERVVGVSVRLIANTPLVVGTLLCGTLFLAALAPQVLAPFEPEERFDFFRVIDGELTAPPFPPDSRYILGSDQRTRDLLSRIIHGTRETLVICVAVTMLRLAIGGILGGIAGWRQGATGRLILSMSEVSGSIPSVLFAYIFIISIGPQLGAAVFVLGLGLTGWAEMTNLVNAAVRRIRAQPYMEGALALGSNTRHLVRRHVWPNISPHVIPATALELSAALLVLAELGFLGLIVGSLPLDILFQSVRIIGEPEWAGMLAGTRTAIFHWPWLSLGPALAFVVAILGFNLLGIGLRGWLDPRQTNVS